MGERAEHPADCVAEFAIGFHKSFEDFRPDAEIVRIVRCRDPEAENVRAGIFDDVLRGSDIAQGFGHFLTLLIQHEAVGENDIEGCAAACSATLQQARLEPTAMLVRAFEIHHTVFAAIDDALDACKRREMRGRVEHIGMGGAGIEPDIEHVHDHVVVIGVNGFRSGFEEALFCARRKPGIATFRVKSGRNGVIDLRIMQKFFGFLVHENRDRHAPCALAGHDPIRLVLDHAANAVFASFGYPFGFLDGVEGCLA